MKSEVITRRTDQVAFVVNPVRTVFDEYTSIAVIEEALNNPIVEGKYATLYRDDLRQINLIQADNKGYALGECFLAYYYHLSYGNPYVIWLEEIDPDTGRVVVVVVVDGEVVLDCWASEQVIDNIARILVDQNEPFTILSYSHFGSQQLLQRIGMGGGYFSAHHVEDFIDLTEPMLEQILPVAKFLLQTNSKAIKNAGLVPNYGLYAICILALLVALWFWFTQPKPAILLPTQVVDYYRDYRYQLQSPAPAIQLYEVIDMAGQLQQLLGLQLDYIDLNGEVITAAAQVEFGLRRHLTEQLTHLGWNVSFEQHVVVLHRSLTLPPRQGIDSIAVHEELEMLIVDRALQLDLQVETEVAQRNAYFTHSGISISSSGNGQNELQAMYALLRGQPMVLNNLRLLPTDGGYRMTLHLDLYGASLARVR